MADVLGGQIAAPRPAQVTDVVADEVGHDRVARLVTLGDPGLDLPQEVGPDIGGLRVDPAAELGERATRREPEPDEERCHGPVRPRIQAKVPPPEERPGGRRRRRTSTTASTRLRWAADAIRPGRLIVYMPIPEMNRSPRGRRCRTRSRRSPSSPPVRRSSPRRGRARQWSGTERDRTLEDQCTEMSCVNSVPPDIAGQGPLPGRRWTPCRGLLLSRAPRCATRAPPRSARGRDRSDRAGECMQAPDRCDPSWTEDMHRWTVTDADTPPSVRQLALPGTRVRSRRDAANSSVVPSGENPASVAVARFGRVADVTRPGRPARRCGSRRRPARRGRARPVVPDGSIQTQPSARRGPGEDEGPTRAIPGGHPGRGRDRRDIEQSVPARPTATTWTTKGRASDPSGRRPPRPVQADTRARPPARTKLNQAGRRSQSWRDGPAEARPAAAPPAEIVARSGRPPPTGRSTTGSSVAFHPA